LDGYLETCKDKGMFTFSSYRDDYLATRKEFYTPVERGQTQPSCAPGESASRLFDYGVLAGGSHMRKAGGGVGESCPLPYDTETEWLAETAAGPGGAVAPDDDIDAYISQLESRSS